MATVDPNELSSFIQVERSVAIWSSPFLRLPFLTSLDLTALVTSIDSSLANGGNYFTPHKNKKGKAAEVDTIQTLALLSSPLLYPNLNGPSSLESLILCVKICCDQVNLLSRASSSFKDSFVVSRLYLRSLQVNLSIIQDHLEAGPGITDIPLRSAWEGIIFVKGSLMDVVSQIVFAFFSLLQERSVENLISQALSSFPPPISGSQFYPFFSLFSLKLR